MPEYNQDDYINLEESLGRLRNNKKIFVMTMNLFLESEEFEKLEQSLAQKDYVKAAEYSHGIKGMVGNLALTRLYETSTALNNELKNGAPNEETVQAYFEALEGTKAVVGQILEQFGDEA